MSKRDNIALCLQLARVNLAHARVAMLRAADRLEATDIAEGLRVRAENLEDMEVGLGFVEVKAGRTEVEA